MGKATILSHFCTTEDLTSLGCSAAPGRGNLTAQRLEEHLRTTSKRLKQLGVGFGDSVASMLPDGPDAITAHLAVTAHAHAKYQPLEPNLSREQYDAILLAADPKLLLVHPGDHPPTHPVRHAARSLGILVVNALRHFEAGVFTMEPAVMAPVSSGAPPSWVPGWKIQNQGVPIVLIAPGLAYRRLANRLDSCHPVIGITPPSLEHLPPPHTIEHLAAECVRVLRRFRPQGPYALVGWRAEGLVAVEMARLLEEEGEQVAFVALLDASELFAARVNWFHRALCSVVRLFPRKSIPSCTFMADALRNYRPNPWYGKILHIGTDEVPSFWHRTPRFEWSRIAPQGVVSHFAPGGILADPGMQAVAAILANELSRALVKA